MTNLFDKRRKMEEYYMKYMKLTMALVAACVLMMPALSMMPDMGQNGKDCQQQMCDRQKLEMGQDNMQMMSGWQGHEMGHDKMMSGCQGHEMGHDKMMSGCQGHEMGHNKMMFVCQGQEMGHDKMMFVCQKAHNVCSKSDDPADSPEIGVMGESEGFEGREGGFGRAEFGEGGFGEGEEGEFMQFEFGDFGEFMPYEFSPFGFNESGFGEEEEE
jgi:hypothetical protein